MGVAVLIVAGGTSQRFGGEVPKQYKELSGKAVLRHTLERFIAQDNIDDVYCVINSSHKTLYERAVEGMILPAPIMGGDTRQASVCNGLEHLAALATPPEYVLIHDAARPFVTDTIIASVIDALHGHSAVVPALPLRDTLKYVDDGVVQNTLEREGLYTIQTPQGFHFEQILLAHRQLAGGNCPDDAAVAELTGIPVHIVAGSERNFKITTLEDWERAMQMSKPEPLTVTGHGFDTHKLGADTSDGAGVMLCGVKVPCPLKLVAHSDGDVGLHALVDALLGTIGAGDIGEHFPPSDDKWRGANSSDFVTHSRGLVEAAGGKVIHADITLICEQPKVSAHKEAMKLHLAELLGLLPVRVSVKATTTEKLGYTGRGEGIAAMATVSVMI